MLTLKNPTASKFSFTPVASSRHKIKFAKTLWILDLSLTIASLISRVCLL